MENPVATENGSHELAQEERSSSLLARLGRFRGILKYFGWSAFALALVLIFTIAKLPTQQMGQILINRLNTQLQYAPGGLEVSAREADLSLFPLPSLQFEDLTLKGRDLTGGFLRVRWAKLKLRPSLLDLMAGRMGGSLSLSVNEAEDPTLVGGAWFKNGKFSVDLQLKKADLGNQGLGILPLLFQVNGQVPLDGSIQLTGDLSELSTSSGLIELKLGKTELPPQKIMAMSFPSLLIREGEIRASIQSTKVKIEKVQLGKKTDSENGPKDDLRGSVSGELSLGKTWDASKIDLKIQFEVSDEVNKAAWLLSSLLAPFKKGEGSYRFGLNGPSYAPLMTPEGE